jgi:hypothetical protein
MSTRMIVPTILAAALLAGPAVTSAAAAPALRPMQTAAAMTPSEKCTAYENQFDMAIKTHAKASRVGEAKRMRSEGGSLCAKGKHVDGVAKLEKALWDLGVTPKA